jgi:hypothetical protein
MSYNMHYSIVGRSCTMIYTTESARRHGLTDDEVCYAWAHAIEYRRVRLDKRPPHYMALGALPDGRVAELAAYSSGLDLVVFHCMTPTTPGFMHEYEGAGKKGRSRR